MPTLLLGGLEALERAEGAELRPGEGYGCDDEHGADAAGDDAGDRAPPGGGDAGLEAAQLVGCADEDGIDGGNSAALGVGGEDLNQRVTNDNGDVVERAGEDQGDHGKPEPAGEAKENRRQAEGGDGPEEGAAGALQWSAMSQEHGHGK